MNVRNIFDQYKSHENRLTHGLACCLNEDRKLLRGFVGWITGKRCPSGSALQTVEQHIPGQPIEERDEDERRGLPDMWIYDNQRWSVVIECKVASSVDTDQLRRHIRTAQRNGFDDITLVVISADGPSRRVPEFVYKTWTEVYRWIAGRILTTRLLECTGRTKMIDTERRGDAAKWPTRGCL